MNNYEFIKLSEKEVKKLNGSESEQSYEAFRAGYEHLRKIIQDKINTCHNSEFLDEMEEIANTEFEIFKFNLM